MQPYLAFHLDPHCLKIVISFIDTAINFTSDWLHLLFFPLVICDVEAHTMFMIFRGEGSKEEDPFREWFSKLGELRSLCPKAQMVALTSTAGPTQRRKIVRSLCFGANSKVIHDSPDRSNIKISSKCIPNNEVPDKTFKWLFSELHTCAENLQRHVIFCQSISDVSKVYMSFVREFGQDSALFDMYHSKTNEKFKEKIRDDMSSNGVIRVFICTNAAGMGVNFFGLNNVIHYGLPYQMDTFVQQMGRAGRDGEFSQELIIFKSHKGQLSKVESDLIKLVKDSDLYSVQHTSLKSLKLSHCITAVTFVISHVIVSPIFVRTSIRNFLNPKKMNLKTTWRGQYLMQRKHFFSINFYHISTP